MAQEKAKSSFTRFQVWRRMYAIFNELGYVPWRKPRKARKVRKEHDGVYIGAREAIPFMNDDGKRTISHLFLRPGYMMRDYILRGQHERYLAPFTALLVFYSVFTLLLAIVRPDTNSRGFGQGIVDGLQEASVFEADSTKLKSVRAHQFVRGLMETTADAVVLTHLDQYPEAIDTPWKSSLAAVEGDIRSKGIPLFLGNFLLIWAALAILLRKYKISVSGAAAASAYILCQYCVFMYLALLLSWGHNSELGLLIVGILLLIDFRQLLGLDIRKAFGLTLKTGLFYVLFGVAFYLLLGGGLILFTFAHLD